MTTLTDCLLKARTEINNTYDLDSEILDVIMKIVEKSCQPLSVAAPAAKATGKAAKASATPKAPRPKSAYNMFVKDQFRQNKEQAKPNNSQEIMSSVSGRWAKLTPEEKTVYTKMAQEANANLDKTPQEAKAPKEKKTTKRRLTGYNVFYRENKDSLKTAPGSGTTTTQAVGKAWNALTDDERLKWNERASKEADSA
jgi:hypothetical protein